MKLLQSHDSNFDVCRSFLVVSMVFTHVFEMFYIPDYNRHLTYFVTIGFVFLSGFTIGALYKEKFNIDPKNSWKKIVRRALKLFILFAVCNAGVFLIKPSSLKAILQLNIFEIIVAVFLGTKQSIFGFDLLIPIALTSFFSGFLLSSMNDRLIIPILVLFSLFIWISEATKSLDYYGVKTLLTGMVGCCLGILSIKLDWRKTVELWSRNITVVIIGLTIFLYYTAILCHNQKSTNFIVYFHLIPTVIIIFYVYILSCKFDFLKKLPYKTLSKNMLFAYLFHIFVINMLFQFIPKDSLGFYQTIFLALFILAFTIVVCYSADVMKTKSKNANKLYSTVFKL